MGLTNMIHWPMAERKDVSLSPEELHGAVIAVDEQKLAELKGRFQGKQFNPELLTYSHDSQAGGAVHYGGVLLFLEADSPDFDDAEVTQKLLGLKTSN